MIETRALANLVRLLPIERSFFRGELSKVHHIRQVVARKRCRTLPCCLSPSVPVYNLKHPGADS